MGPVLPKTAVGRLAAKRSVDTGYAIPSCGPMRSPSLLAHPRSPIKENESSCDRFTALSPSIPRVIRMIALEFAGAVIDSLIEFSLVFLVSLSEIVYRRLKIRTSVVHFIRQVLYQLV